MAAKVPFGFGRLSDAELDNFAQGVIDAMIGNAALALAQEIKMPELRVSES